MNILELEEHFGQFIEFGKVFDRTTRFYLVKYLKSKFLQINFEDDSIQESKYYSYFRQSLDKLFENQDIFRATKGNHLLTHQLMEDIFKWLRKTDQKIQENNPYFQDYSKLQAWSHKPTFLWKKDWQILIQYLSNQYEPTQIEVSFYEKKFIELMPDAPNTPLEQKAWDSLVPKPFLELVIHDLLANWDAIVSAKILEYQLEEIAKEGENFVQLITAKVKEYLKIMDLLSSFSTEAGRFWDLSRGLWKDTSFDILDKYSELLKNEASIQELVDLLGRMREAEIELEEETFQEVVVRKEWMNDELLKEEVTGIHKSNQLSLILPSEAALLAEDITAPAFYQKFADSSLLTFRYEGKKLVQSDREHFTSFQKQKLKEKGPFILCIDTSGSMLGLPSQIAKVLMFAIMKMAAKEKRKCYLISFSIGIKTIQLHDLANSMDKIVEFLSMSFDGGTDVVPALSEALNVLQTNEYRDADVLMVSDFVMFKVREDIVERIRKEQHKGTRFHSLTIGNRPNPEVLESYDNCWAYHPEDKSVIRQMLKDIYSLSNIE
jgi:uncharacterized protein with von Willebrand factor type A (vWA) domain